MDDRRVDGDDGALMTEAIATEGVAQRAALDGDADAASDAFSRAAGLYRQSWEAAPPRAFGRLVGMLKASVLAGSGEDEAAGFALSQVEEPDSPPSFYVVGVASLLTGDDEIAARAAEGMRAGSEAFGRAADALAALAAGDADAYTSAVQAIVTDFEGRDDHLTGVPFADTALMFERIAERRGIGAAGLRSALLP
jgi:hypothetical protein